jgi:hypothetical protein
VKLTLNTVTLETQGKSTEFVIWAEIHKPAYDYALLVPRDLYLELLKGIAVDEVHFFNTLSLYAILNESYQLIDDIRLKEEVYHAAVRRPNDRT